MSESDKQTDRINAQVIGFPVPGQARLLIGPGSGYLDGGVPVDIALELIPAELQADGKMVIAVYQKDTLEILAVEPDTSATRTRHAKAATESVFIVILPPGCLRTTIVSSATGEGALPTIQTDIPLASLFSRCTPTHTPYCIWGNHHRPECS